ncbi:MAG: Dabb family protein [Gorillibacterium sp.]|nr:Dabb family protein [Gorillibacterium sp.]
MYEHLVLFKFKSALSPEKENELLHLLHAFKEVIPGIVSLTAGINTTEEVDHSQGYSLGLRVTFEDQEALRQYGPHPVHQDFVKLLDGLVENVIVVDYSIGHVIKL